MLCNVYIHVISTCVYMLNNICDACYKNVYTHVAYLVGTRCIVNVSSHVVLTYVTYVANVYIHVIYNMYQHVI